MYTTSTRRLRSRVADANRSHHATTKRPSSRQVQVAPRASSNTSQELLTRRSIALGLGLTLALSTAELPSQAEDALTSPALSKTIRKVYLTVTIDGKPAGKITFELFPEASVGAQRFADLCMGKEGVAYRLSKFDYVTERYIRNEGVRKLSYSADGVSPIAGGESVADLEAELEQSTRQHTEPYLVSLVVKEAKERPAKEKLVAVGGKLVTVVNQAGEAPNGTAFVISKEPTPELDDTNLIVARVVDGFDTLETISNVPVVKNNEGSPFFMAAKAVGDKRADVAEKGFNKPLVRVLVAKGGAVAV